MKFTLPVLEKISTNKIYAGIHWTRRNKHKEAVRGLGYLVKGKITEFPVKLKFTFKLKGRVLDCSNLSYMGKMYEDMFVKSGLIPDDTPKYISEVTYVSTKGDNEVDIEFTYE